MALPLVGVLVLHASAFEMGLIAAASYVAWLLVGLPAGVLTQRVSRLTVQVSMDLVRAVAVLWVPVAWWWGALSVAHLVVVALVSLGGLVVQAVGAVPTMLVDAASYLVSAVLLRTLPQGVVTRRDTWPPVRAMIREGWQYVVRHPVMAPWMCDATIINAVCGAQLALYPLYLVRDLGAPPGLVGLQLAAEGAGTLVGAAVTPRLVRRFGTARACLLAAVAQPIGVLLVPLGAGGVGFALFAAATSPSR
ncbi:MAG: MFS transporter [Lapillicoccus sp.]